jgi:hypothetical protein
MWPGTAAELVRVQHELAARTPLSWRPFGPRPLVAGCFVCFRRGQRRRGRVEEPGWAAAVLMQGDRRQAGSAVVSGSAAAPYEPGLLAMREGPLLDAAVRALPEPPEVVMANAPGRGTRASPRSDARPAERRGHRPAPAGERSGARPGARRHKPADPRTRGGGPRAAHPRRGAPGRGALRMAHRPRYCGLPRSRLDAAGPNPGAAATRAAGGAPSARGRGAQRQRT